MKKYFLFIIAICLATFVVQSVHGAENTFEASLSVLTDDYAPPSIPTGLAASALSSTQINLVWNAATDDVAVIGYRIFRDGAVIGTTTSIFYQDSGLVASTSYDYTVESFDSIPNYSGQSATSTAVTLAAPVIPPDPEPVDEESSSTNGNIPRPSVNPDLAQLANVANLKAVPSEKSIALTWNNPPSRDFDGVRIVRSDRFYPRDIFDGEVVYQGRGEVFLDHRVNKEKTYYYTVFSAGIMVNGERAYSSGVLAVARPLDLYSKVPVVIDPLGSIKFLQNVDPRIASLSLFDFDFIQDSKKLAVVGEGLIVDSSRNLMVSLAYDKIPELLKTIVVTLTDPLDSSKTFSFLLRVNKKKTAYEAVVAPLDRSGQYSVGISILDYKNQGLKKIEGSLRTLPSMEGGYVFKEVERVTLTDFSRYLIAVGSVLVIILILVRMKFLFI